MVGILEEAPALAGAGVWRRGETVAVDLSSLRGRWVVVFFYPRDFTPVCPTEIMELSRRQPELAALGADAIGVSCDGLETHRRWIAEVLGEVAFPLVADPDGTITVRWGAWLASQGTPARATFLVDPGGVVQYVGVHPPGVGRSISEILRVIEALQTGRPAPADWRPGQPTLDA